MSLNTEIMSNTTHFLKYAKYLETEKRRETWVETVYRNRDMHIRKYPNMAEEISKVYEEFVSTKLLLPSMRSMQFGGLPIELNESRLFNCCFLPMDHWKAFREVMFLLIGGTGVGYSVQYRHVSKLPSIRKPTKIKKYLIADNMIGWANAVEVLMKAYLDGGALPKFDYRDIRKKGTPLKTSGGKAPGPEPLKRTLTNIQNLLDSKENGQKLSSLEVHDINCFIADAVLSAGIREAAMIAMFSIEDQEMLQCKSNFNVKIIEEKQISEELWHVMVETNGWSQPKTHTVYLDKKHYEMLRTKSKLPWWYFEPQRARSNNSAVFIIGHHTENTFKNLWKKVEESEAGEPGIYFTNDPELGSNPCVETSLRPFQFCVSGDTKLITRDGLEEIKDVVGKDIEIWNGEKWSKVTPFITGTSDTLYRVNFSDGSYLDSTANHKFLVKNRFQKEYVEVETIDLIQALKESKYDLHTPPHSIVCDSGIEEPLAYEYGFYLGDGYINGTTPYIALYGVKMNLKLKNMRSLGERVNPVSGKHEIVKFEECNRDLAAALRKKDSLPREVFSWDKNSIIGFMSGWLDADGSNTPSGGARLYGCEGHIRDAQLLLSKVGIKSTVNLMSKIGEETNLGTRTRDMWYLQIVKTSDFVCQRLECTNIGDNLNKQKMQRIESIEQLPGLHMSYCFNEPELHQGVFNNVLTKQCNLCEINGSTITSKEDLEKRAKAAAFIGTLQAGYTDFHYLRDIWKETTEKDALLGVSITGTATGIPNEWLESAAKAAVDENKRVAALIGIKPAARVTCIKPAGTSSLILGTSSGCHAWYDKFYIRRIRINKTESVYQYLKEKISSLLEDSKSDQDTTAYLCVPMKAPDGAITAKEETSMQFLDRVKNLSIHWVKPGHVHGDNTHNVSATVYVKPDEWETVGKWMWDNKNVFHGLSVLPFNGGTYVQAPHESITEEQYNHLSKHLTQIDLSMVMEKQDTTSRQNELACVGGVCSIE